LLNIYMITFLIHVGIWKQRRRKTRNPRSGRTFLDVSRYNLEMWSKLPQSLLPLLRYSFHCFFIFIYELVDILLFKQEVLWNLQLLKNVHDASRERLRLQAIEAYRGRKGWTSRPGLHLPPPVTTTSLQWYEHNAYPSCFYRLFLLVYYLMYKSLIMDGSLWSNLVFSFELRKKVRPFFIPAGHNRR